MTYRFHEQREGVLYFSFAAGIDVFVEDVRNNSIWPSVFGTVRISDRKDENE